MTSIRLQANQEQSQQTRRQTRNIDRARRQLESQEDSQIRTQTRNTRDRASRQLESLEQSETRRQARRVLDRHCQTVHRQAHFYCWRPSLDNFKSDSMILLDFSALCNCFTLSDKTKKVSNTILLDTCPDFQPQQPIEKVYSVPSVKPKQLKDCGLLGQYQMVCVLMTFLLN